MRLRVRSVRYANKSINAPAANKQGATKLDSRVKNLIQVYIYAIFTSTYLCL